MKNVSFNNFANNWQNRHRSIIVLYNGTTLVLFYESTNLLKDVDSLKMKYKITPL